MTDRPDRDLLGSLRRLQPPARILRHTPGEALVDEALGVLR